MKVNVKLLSENKCICLEIDETSMIETLGDLLNSQFNSNEIFYFIYNKLICETGKTLAELEFIDDCVVFAAKRSDKPLKRKLENENLSHILTCGSFPKKTCAINSENVDEHTIWQNKGLSEMQLDLNDVLLNNPFQFEPLMLQGPIEEMIRNPSIINSLYSANPVLNEMMDKKPEQLKFFTDLSQYDWMKSVIADSSEMERVSIHYSQNYKNIIDSKRFKRMQEILEKVDGAKPDESETLETPDYDEKSLGVFTKSQYIHNLTDLLLQDSELMEQILKSCPYGSNMSPENVSEINKFFPEAMNTFKKALVKQAKGGDSIYKYLSSHPITMDEATAQRLEEATGVLPESQLDASGTTDNNKIYEMLHKINSWVNLTPVNTTASNVDAKVTTDSNYDKEIQLLNEMGFTDNEANMNALSREYGSVNRAAIALAVLPLKMQ